MFDSMSRRGLFSAIPAVCVASAARASAAPQCDDPAANSGLYPEFPSHDPKLVREMVGVSHGNLDRVRALVSLRPALARATWDWGFGDWETALGAASHVGNREIATLLISHGARPDLFTFAMLGQLEVVKAYVAANPGIQRIAGPHGLTLLHHARAGGDEAKSVVAYLEGLGDADVRPEAVALSDEEKPRYVGSYRCSQPGPCQLEVAIDRRGNLAIARKPDGSNRILVYSGNHEFQPVGTPAVRVRFALVDGAARGLTIFDGDLVVVATREV